MGGRNEFGLAPFAEKAVGYVLFSRFENQTGTCLRKWVNSSVRETGGSPLRIQLDLGTRRFKDLLPPTSNCMFHLKIRC